MRDRILESVDYNPNNGLFTWKYNPSKQSNWNSRFSGKPAFITTDRNGYLYGRVDYVRYLAHRVAWLISSGVWPDLQIDHINGIKSDNRICNLRQATISENQWNRPINKNNTSGYKGVCWSKKEGKWVAHINYMGRQKRLGCFTNHEDAYAAYCRASMELHGEYGRVS